MPSFDEDAFYTDAFDVDSFDISDGGDPGDPSAAARMLRVRRFGSIKWAILLMATTALTHV